MNFVAISQRDDFLKDRNEHRDGLEDKWTLLLNKIGLTPYLIPNKEEHMPKILEELKIKRIVLSGGGNLTSHSNEDVSPEREAREHELLEYAIKYKIPVIGVCRGLQAICEYFGVISKPIEGHNKVRHDVTLTANSIFEKHFGPTSSVNSFHNFAVRVNELNEELELMAKCDDAVEAVKHKELPFYGIAWHPEREPRDAEVNLIKEIFSL